MLVKEILFEAPMIEQNIVQILLRDCPRTVHAILHTAQMLIRGLGDAPATFKGDIPLMPLQWYDEDWERYRIIELPLARCSVRKDRVPKHSSKALHDAADNFFFAKYKWKARSESMFCSSDKFTAKSYGEPYYVFPIGKFKFLWSPEVDDLYTEAPPVKADDAKSVQEFNAWLRKCKYTTTDLNAAMVWGHEIMVNCAEYYAIPMSKVDAPTFIKALHEAVERK